MTKPVVRRTLLLLGPLAVLIAGAWMYFTGGRYVHTDNAYVKADIVAVSPEVSGAITAVSIDDNQPVTKGQLLLTIDRTPFDIALAQAEANLLSSSTQIEALKSRYHQKESDLAIAKSDLDLAQKNYARRRKLLEQRSSAISAAEMDDASHALEIARQRLALLDQEKTEILATLLGNPDIAVTDHPLYKAALAARDKAALDLARTKIRAPADGVVGAAPSAGDYAHAQVPVMNVIAAGRTWIEANFKETELTRMQPGQKVRIGIDTYPGQEWTGTVESISPAAASEFAILPAQNATGNWVKVVQRIPVRIAVQHHDGEPVLRPGMSTAVRVDTGSYPHM